MFIVVAAVIYWVIRFALPRVRTWVARRKREPAMIALRIPMARPVENAARHALQLLRVCAHRARVWHGRRDDRVRLHVPGERSSLPGA